MRTKIGKAIFAIVITMLLMPDIATADFISEPVVDYKESLTVSPRGPITTHFRIFRWEFWDARSRRAVSEDVDMLGLAYITAPTLDSEFLTIITIYGIDLDPFGSSLAMTGFDPINPQVILDSPETFFNNSFFMGTAYTSDFNIDLSLGILGGVLPGFDLSPFQGDPNSIIYLSSTTVPAANFLSPVPEPSSLSSLAFGGLFLIKHFLKRRRNSSVHRKMKNRGQTTFFSEKRNRSRLILTVLTKACSRRAARAANAECSAALRAAERRAR